MTLKRYRREELEKSSSSSDDDEPLYVPLKERRKEMFQKLQNASDKKRKPSKEEPKKPEPLMKVKEPKKELKKPAKLLRCYCFSDEKLSSIKIMASLGWLGWVD